MRVILHNPHTSSWYKTSVYQYLGKMKASLKYEYFLDYLYEKGKVFVFIDDFDIPIYISGIFRKYISPLFGFYLWVLINGMKPSKFVIIRDINKLTDKDALITFSYSNFASHIRLSERKTNNIITKFQKIKAFKVVNLTHFVWDAKYGSENMQKADVDLFVSENNLSKNSSFFKKYFPWYKKNVYILPFVPQKRFVSKKKYSERKNKAIAVGSLNKPIKDTMDNDFVDFFGNQQFHPMRNEIFVNKEKIKKSIDSYIPVYDGNIKCENCNKKNTIYIKIKNKILRSINNTYKLYLIMNAIVKKRKKFSYSNDRDYMKFDLASTFNEYQMCIVPEERVGLPGISFVEAMACGCAYLGIRSDMYTDIGLIDKVHYIGYDGSLDDLISKISYYQNHEDELNEIAKNGYKFIKVNINNMLVMDKFMKDLENEINKKNEKI